MAIHTQSDTNYTVVQGDHGPKLAFLNKLENWKTIWDDGKNATLKTDRPASELLLPGDQMWIPPAEKKEDNKETGKLHPYVQQETTVKLQMRLLDGQHKPYKATECKITVDTDAEVTKTTDGDGKFTVEKVKADAKVAVLKYLGRTVELTIGWLDPIEEDSGVKGRLKNLSYIPGDIEGTIDSPPSGADQEFTDALKAFQSQYKDKCGKEPDGVMDDNTRKALKDVYGC